MGRRVLARYALDCIPSTETGGGQRLCPSVHGRWAIRRSRGRPGQVAGVEGRRKLAQVGQHGDHLQRHSKRNHGVRRASESGGDAFESEIPERLFLGPVTGIDWDVTPDGQRFLWAVPQVQQAAQAPISVVLNWPALMKK